MHAVLAKERVCPRLGALRPNSDALGLGDSDLRTCYEQGTGLLIASHTAARLHVLPYAVIHPEVHPMAGYVSYEAHAKASVRPCKQSNYLQACKQLCMA